MATIHMIRPPPRTTNAAKHRKRTIVPSMLNFSIGCEGANMIDADGDGNEPDSTILSESENGVVNEESQIQNNTTSEMRMLDLCSGCGAMSIGLCLGVNMPNVNLVSCHVGGGDSQQKEEPATIEEEDDNVDNVEIFQLEQILSICYGDPKEIKKSGLYLKETEQLRTALEKELFKLEEFDSQFLILDHKVASASYGDLYKGTYRSEEVAIKILKTERLKSVLQKEFAQEVYILRKVRHKNVVQFIRACTKPPSLCIVVSRGSAPGRIFPFLSTPGIRVFYIAKPSTTSLCLEICHHRMVLGSTVSSLRILFFPFRDSTVRPLSLFLCF
ncbi:hypothetical protein L2E82_45378 [Cichorium intybus]|uniref:Uncharacterized protein n=1 Tax=Cichorium intybus TaxID=13427 RepID=A0ACB8ZTP2_CICIN|nr:hypothetical protein L2E82_45378 [Cichorium intybus]